MVDAAPAPDAEHDSGSMVPLAATAGLVAVIGGAAVRRQAPPPCGVTPA